MSFSSGRRAVALLGAAALVLGATALVAAAPTADAAAQPIASSSLQWGFKASFRSYINNFGGTITASAGATKVNPTATAPFSWTGAGGSYDPATKVGTLDFAGKVVFREAGHTIWHITIANPSLVLDGDATGTLLADVSYATGGTEADPENVSTQTDVNFGSVAVGSPTVNGATSTYPNQATTLTGAGSAAFNGFYQAGTELDPVTAWATVGAQALTITQSGLPDGLVGKSYVSTQLSSTGGKASYTYALAAGSLPAGLVLSAGGKISGTPTNSGTSTFTVKALDATKPTKLEGAKLFSITVAPITINPVAIPTGLVGKAFKSTTFKATGGKAALKWDVSGGALPAGLKLSTSGALSGTPVTAGSYPATIRVSDASTPKNTATQQITITIAPMTILPVTVPSGLVGKAFTTTAFKANGGKSSLVWTAINGPLPAGLKLSTSGSLSGTPTAAGTYAFTVQVADASVPKNYASVPVTVTIAPMTVATAGVPNGKVATKYTTTALKANGGKATLVWTVAPGSSLPPGLTLSTAGSLAGKPTVAGSYTFTVQVADANTPKNYATKQFTVVVAR